MPSIVNFKYADLKTAKAAADMAALGMVCKVTLVNGARTLTVLGDTDDALVVSGNYAVAMKYGTDAYEVDTTTADTALTGDRRVSIKQGDLIVEARKGTILEYDASEVDASLDPNRAGALPTDTDTLGVKGGLWCTNAAASPTGIQNVAKVHSVSGTKIKIELTY